MKKKQPKVFEHAKCIVVNRGNNFDLIDPQTGRWQNFPTQRSAKWSASIWRRLSGGFGYNDPTESILQTYLVHEQRKLEANGQT